MNPRNRLAAILVLTLMTSTAFAADKDKKPTLKLSKLGATPNVHTFGKTLLCGQPGKAAFASAKERGIKVVVTLRQKGEVNWNAAAVVEGLGLEFHRVGFGSPASLTDDVFNKTLKILAKSKKKPVMLYCGSANRVGAIWAAHRVVNDGLSLDAALKEAKEVGLRTPGYVDQLKAYLARKKK